jgi:hypothetical protein
MFAQVVLPVCQWCAELKENSWEWWLRGCWQFDCTPQEGGLILMGVTIAGYVGAQLWAASKTPKGN